MVDCEFVDFVDFVDCCCGWQLVVGCIFVD
jgi:hypothetical protein